MIGGTGNSPKSNYKLLTGIGAVKLLKVNPTNEEYESIVGTAMPYELKYDVVTFKRGDDDVDFRPIRIITHNEEHDVYSMLEFYICEVEEVSKDGSKVNSIDPAGVQAWNAVDGSTNYTWFDSKESRPLMIGESALHDLLQTYLKYDRNAEEAQWLIDLASAGITVSNLFANKTAGLQALLDWANTQTVEDGIKGHTVGVLYTVKKTDKKDKETGTIIVGEYNYNQSLYTRAFFYTDKNGTVAKSSFDKLKKLIKKQDDAGYSVTKNLFTVNFQEFDEDKCLNTEPVEALDKSKLDFV